MTNSSKKKILIIGASGFIGQALYRGLKTNLSEEYDITGTYCNTRAAPILERLDVTKYNELEQFLLKLKHDFILLAAGNKNVLDCERVLTWICVNNNLWNPLYIILGNNPISGHLLFNGFTY